MKKIIVETVGNSIMVSLFAASLVEFFSMNAQYTDNGFESTTGNISIVFVVYLILNTLTSSYFSLLLKICFACSKGYFLLEIAKHVDPEPDNDII